MALNFGSFVINLYQNVLGRTPDQAGLEYWNNQLENGWFTKAEVIEQFVTSTEVVDVLGPIARLYYAVFGRSPDVEGWTYWTNLSRAGLTLNEIAAEFVNSQEFRDTVDGSTNEKFIDSLYEHVLGRLPDAEGRAYWVEQINAGLSRADIVTYFSESEEFVDQAGQRVSVTLAYQGATGSPPSEGQLEDGVAQLEGGATVGDLIEDILLEDTLPNVFTLQQLRTVEQLPDTLVTELVTYWGNPATGEGVPFSEVWDTVKDYLTLPADIKGILFDINDSLVQIENITLSGVTDEAGEDAAGDYTGTYTISVTLSDGTINSAIVELTQTQLEYINGVLFDAEGNSRLFEKEVPYLVDGVDSNGNPIRVQAVIEGDTIVTSTPIRLTPNQNNNSTLESGRPYTTGDNDTIVAGHLELLHQAFIDGGEGYNTLKVEAKGAYAQPARLTNIQEVQINDLPNFYTEWTVNSDGSIDLGNTYPDLALHTNLLNPATNTSWIDLSSASELQRVVITDQGNVTVPGLGSVVSGDLYVVGIRNNATVALEGGFTDALTLSFAEGLTGQGINLDLNVGNVTGTLNILNASSVLNINSIGVENYLKTFFVNSSAGSSALSRLNISGEASLVVESNIGGIFHRHSQAVIDASANTGGVSLGLDETAYSVTIIGSQGNDVFEVSTTSGPSDATQQSVTIDGGVGNNAYEVYSEVVTITVADGKNSIVAGGEAVTIETGNGNNTIEVNGVTNQNNEGGTVSITTGAGDDSITALRAQTVTIDAGEGDNAITVSGKQIDVTTGAGDDSVVVNGIGREGFGDGNYTALINIDTGAGEDTVVLGRDWNTGTIGQLGITALQGSSITGENITLEIENPADLRAATLEGIEKVVLNYDVSQSINVDVDAYGVQQVLTLTTEQFAAIGAENFEVYGSAFSTYAQIKLIVTASTSLTALGVENLPSGVDLVLEIQDGATLTLTAEQLHKYVAPQGITLADDYNTDNLSGSVVITNAGLNFDPFNTNDQARTNIDGKVYYGGSLSDDFYTDVNNDGIIQRSEWGFNVKLDATLNGYNRPADVPALSRLVIDTNQTSDQNIGPFSSHHTFLRIVGDNDLTFTPVSDGRDDWGQQIKGGSAIELGVDASLPADEQNEFIIDFASLNGQVINLAVARFEDAAEIWGNGTSAEPARLNVELTGNVGSATGGLFSRDVQTYVVTKLNGENREFWTSKVTQGLETLGLRGNYGETISFLNTERGVDFLLEVAYDKNDGYSVGALNGVFARAGADAVVNVAGLDDLPLGGKQNVQGISLANSASATINVTGEQALTIETFTASAALKAITLTAEADLTIKNDLAGVADATLAIDATGVVGKVAISLGDHNQDFSFDGAEGGSAIKFNGDFTADDGEGDGTTTSIDGGTAGVELELAEEVIVNLKEAELVNVTEVTLGQNSALTLTLDQADDIGAGNFALALGATAATLNLSGLAEQEFAVANYDDGINVELVELAKLPVITLHPNTDLSDITKLVVHEGTVLNLTAAQFQQLNNAGIIEGVGGTTEFTVNITGLTQADLDDGFDLSGITADNVTVTLAESVKLAATDSFGTLANTEVIIGGFTLELAVLEQADGLAVTGAAGGVLQFNDTTLAPTTSIDASGFDVDVLRVLNVLVANQNIDAIFAGLPERVEKVVYTGQGWVDGVNQTVVIEAGTTVPGFLTLDQVEEGVEILNFTLNLDGGAHIAGNLNLTGTGENSLIHQHLQTVVINSTGTAANLLTGKTANIIDGNINPLATADDTDGNNNNLLNLTINAEQALEIKGDIVFSSVVGDDHVTANDDDAAVAVLTIEGAADVKLGGLNTQDDDVDGLIVTNNGTGTVKATLDAADIDQDIAGDNNDALSFLGSNIELTTVGAINLSDDVITGVSKIDVVETGELTLSYAQLQTLTAANVNVVDGPDAGSSIQPATLTINAYDGGAFDATTLDENFETVNLVLVNQNVVLDAGVNLTDVDEVFVQEGRTLTLTAEQFQQLQGNGKITTLDTNDNGTVTPATINITGLTQAQVDAGFNLTEIAGAKIVLTLAEDVNFLGAENNPDGHDETELGDLNNLTINLEAGQTLGLGKVDHANGLTVNGPAATLVYQFSQLPVFPATPFQIDASGYNVAVLKALAASFNTGNSTGNIEFVIDDLNSSVELRLYENPEDLGFLNATHRKVVIEEGITTPSGLVFNDWDVTDEVRTLHLTLEGDVTLNGNLSLPAFAFTDPDLVRRYFETLTIVSEGTEPNTINGNIDTVGGPFDQQNNLLNVIIDAQQELAITSPGAGVGDIVFSYNPSSNLPAATAGVANLTVTGTANVQVDALNVTDGDLVALNVNNVGGTLTLTGSSPAINGVGNANFEELNFSGSGDIVIGDHNLGSAPFGIEAPSLSKIDASGLSGDLSLGEIKDIDSADFSFISGTGVTKLTLTTDSLNSTGLDGVAGNADDAAGWNFDFSNANVGSEFHINSLGVLTDGSKLNIDLGGNTTLYIDNPGVAPVTVDLSGLDLDIIQTLPIVLADNVTLKLTAEQASGLNIVAGADTGATGYTGKVEIVDLGNYTELNTPTTSPTSNDDAAELFDYDFSGILVSASATLFDNDVTLSTGTILGNVAINLADVTDGTYSNDELAGQTIRFATVEQAEREVNAPNPVGGNTKSTNVVWLFNSITAPVDTVDYSDNIARLWVTEELINNYGGDVEQLFTTLPNSILRVDFSDLTALNVLLSSGLVHRTVELVHFTTLNDVTFSDVGIDHIEHIQSLNLKLGGQVTIGNIVLDDVLGVGTHDPASVVFETLTLNSQRALHQNHLLASEHFVNDNDGIDEVGEHAQPNAVNTIGNISVGAGLDLLNVVINTFENVDPTLPAGQGPQANAGAVLNVGTLTYGARTAADLLNPNIPTLVVTGQNDVNITSVIATDPELGAAVVLTNNLVGAALNAPGASPAIELGDQIELLEIKGVEATAVTNLGSDDVANPNAGVSGAGLSKIDASGYAGTLNLGILALIDGSDDDTDEDGTPDQAAFELVTGSGITTATLGADPDSADVPTLEAGSEWIFDYTAAAVGSSLTITDDVVFLAPAVVGDPQAKLTLNEVRLVIDGHVDLKDVDLALTNTAIYVAAGNTLELTVAQALAIPAGSEVVGEGTLKVVGNADDLSLNFPNIKTVNLDLSEVVITAADANGFVEVDLAASAAEDDDGNASGFNVIGSTDHKNWIVGSALDDTIEGGAGNDNLIDSNGDDTFKVTEGVDWVEFLDDGDALVVSNGATAHAFVNATYAGSSFEAAASTINDGIANVYAEGNVTIDLSAATGSNGFTLYGTGVELVYSLNGTNFTTANGDTVLIGSSKADTFVAGNGKDTLTGNGGADIFEFIIDISTPATLTAPAGNVTNAIDQEVIRVNTAGTNAPDAALTITYKLNNVVTAFVVNLGAVDVTNTAAVASAIATQFNAVVGLTAVVDGGNPSHVVVTGQDGNLVNINTLTFTNAGVLAADTVDGTDQAQVKELTVTFAAGETAVPGEKYNLTVLLKDGTEIKADTVTAVGGEDALNIAQKIVNDFNVKAAGAITAVAAGDAANATITLTDNQDNDGGFTVPQATFNSSGGVSGSTASDLNPGNLTTADVITDFASGVDKIDLGLANGTNANYAEAAEVANYAAAKLAAEAAFNGTVQYFLTSLTDGEGNIEDGAGVLFFDANLDGSVDGVIGLLGVNSDTFAFGDIIATV